jgi:hypothetical protein
MNCARAWAAVAPGPAAPPALVAVDVHLPSPFRHPSVSTTVGAGAERAPWAWLAALGALSGALSLWLGVDALGGVPHVSDEQAYLLQARIFAEGERVAPALRGLHSLLVYVRLAPEHYGVFPIGWPLVLSLGVLGGVPAAVNPVLSALVPLAGWHAFSRELGGRVALIAAAVLALSPGLVVLAGSMMSHTLTLLCTLGFMALAPRQPLLASASLGLLLLTRPFDFAVVGAPALAWQLWSARSALRAALPLLVGPLLALTITAADNHARTRDMFTLPVSHYHETPDETGARQPPGCNQLGFGADRGCFGERGHTPARALTQLGWQLDIFDRLFLGFRGSSVLVLVGAVLLSRRGRWELLWPMVAVPLAYGLYWYAGIVYGARFWTLVYVGAAPAAALALHASAGALARRGLKLPWLPAVVLFAGLSALPALHAELSDRYMCVDPKRALALADADLGPGPVVLADSGEFEGDWPLTIHGPVTCTGALASAGQLASNDPFARPGPLYIRAAGPVPATLAAALKDHAGPAHLVLTDLTTGVWRVGDVDRASGTVHFREE